MKKILILSIIAAGVLFSGSFAPVKADSAVNNTKAKTVNAAEKTADKVKSAGAAAKEKTAAAAKKTAEGTKNITKKTADGTRNLIDDIFARELSADELQKHSSLKILKNEKKELKAAYNSRIKDTKAKIKLIEKSSIMTDAQKQSKIFAYETQILDLEQQRDSAVKKYDFRIKELKSN